jgi:glycosyltransferase involved in cell wall biosynthesis
MNQLKISVVTTSFNQERFLKDCLLSVKEQEYGNVEHLVIDGGSTDGSVDLLRSYSARPGWAHLRWISERDRGQSDALNKGFRMATGDVIGWLNSDDMYLPQCLKNVSDALRGNPGADILYGDYTFVDEVGYTTQLRREISFSKFVLFHTHVNFLQSSGAVFLARRVIDLGHFVDETYHYAMDYEYFLRLAVCGFSFRHVPELLGAFRWHGDSKSTAQSEKQFAEHEMARMAHLGQSGTLGSSGRNPLLLFVLRQAANGRRWGEKALRGYYFSQFRPTRRSVSVTSIP